MIALRNSVHLTFQGDTVLISTDAGGQVVLTTDQAQRLYRKFQDSALVPSSPPADTTLAPTDCARCAIDDRPAGAWKCGCGRTFFYAGQCAVCGWAYHSGTLHILCDHDWKDNLASDGPRKWCTKCGAWG